MLANIDYPFRLFCQNFPGSDSEREKRKETPEFPECLLLC